MNIRAVKKKHFFSRSCPNPKPTSWGAENNEALNIRSRYTAAWDISSDRNRIHPNKTSRNVTPICVNSFTEGRKLFSATESLYLLFWPNNNNGRNNNAWYAPHATNVQLAPCQNPLTKKITRVFRKLFHFPTGSPLAVYRYNPGTKSSTIYANAAKTPLYPERNKDT